MKICVHSLQTGDGGGDENSCLEIYFTSIPTSAVNSLFFSYEMSLANPLNDISRRSERRTEVENKALWN